MQAIHTYLPPILDGSRRHDVVTARHLCVTNWLPRHHRSATSTSSGIAIAVGDNDAAPQGEVIAVGPGRQTSMGGVAPMDVSKGDNVMFQSFAGSDVTLVGGKYKVVSASDCIAKW